jgi:hypothetical protein
VNTELGASTLSNYVQTEMNVVWLMPSTRKNPLLK